MRQVAEVPKVGLPLFMLQEEVVEKYERRNVDLTCVCRVACTRWTSANMQCICSFDDDKYVCMFPKIEQFL